MNSVRKENDEMTKLLQEIQDGFWGREIKKYWDELSTRESDELISILYKQLTCNGRRLYFSEALSILFPCADFYYHTKDEKIILCLPYPKSDENVNRLRLIRDLFLDVSNIVDVFWDKHIGIINLNKTMHIGKIAIYDNGTRKEM